jgi:hypothetical protein
MLLLAKRPPFTLTLPSPIEGEGHVELTYLIQIGAQTAAEVVFIRITSQWPLPMAV